MNFIKFVTFFGSLCYLWVHQGKGFSAIMDSFSWMIVFIFEYLVYKKEWLRRPFLIASVFILVIWFYYVPYTDSGSFSAFIFAGFVFEHSLLIFTKKIEYETHGDIDIMISEHLRLSHQAILLCFNETFPIKNLNQFCKNLRAYYLIKRVYPSTIEQFYAEINDNKPQHIFVSAADFLKIDLARLKDVNIEFVIYLEADIDVSTYKLLLSSGYNFNFAVKKNVFNHIKKNKLLQGKLMIVQ